MAASKLSTATVTKPFDGICAKISAFYFDLDNTLIPTRAGDSKAIRKVCTNITGRDG